MPSEAPFWKTKKLSEMSPEEWESLCDGCAQCCLHKLEDEDSGFVYHTNVACRLLDLETCRCTDYQNRSSLVPGCLVLTLELAGSLTWLPETCAYRRLATGYQLEWWHPLVAGDCRIVHELGISVRGNVVSEKDVGLDNLEDHIINDPDA